MSTETNIQPAKVYQGSAVYDAFGGCIFTPYDSNPAENTPWTVLCASPNGKIACTKKKLKIQLTFDRTDASIIVAKVNREIASLVSQFMKAKVIKLYKECAYGKPETPTDTQDEENDNEERPFGYDVTNT